VQILWNLLIKEYLYWDSMECFTVLVRTWTENEWILREIEINREWMNIERNRNSGVEGLVFISYIFTGFL